MVSEAIFQDNTAYLIIGSCNVFDVENETDSTDMSSIPPAMIPLSHVSPIAVNHNTGNNTARCYCTVWQLIVIWSDGWNYDVR